jgi:hypothetical protein
VSLLPSQKFSVNEILKEISIQVAKPKIVKIYTDGWATELIDYKAEVVNRFNMSPIDALFLDVSVLANAGLTHIFILTPRLLDMKNRIVHLKNKNLKIFLLKKVGPIKKVTFSAKEMRRVSRSLSVGFDMGSVSDGLIGNNKILNQIYEMIAEEARFGKIMVERCEFIEKVSGRFQCTYEDSSRVIEFARDRWVVNQISIKINEKVLIFFSLRVSQVSPKVLEWVLKSLKLEELAPTKHMISTRLSKVFNLTLTKQVWRSLKAKRHKRSSSLLEDKHRLSKKGKLFFIGKSYEGLDTFTEDVFKVKSLDCWDEFLEFCENYYKVHFKQSIPMGRFGLLTLVKYLGCESLKQLSSGKLIYLINLAIKEEFLQYKYPNLFWTKDFRILDNKLFSKLRTIKNCIINLVSKAPVRLSCLKLVLRSKFGLELNLKDFGYSKLKEMIQSIPELELINDFIHIRHNTLIDTEALCELINEIVKEKEYGVTESVLQVTLQARLNNSIDWSLYNVSSCSEFIKKYSRNEIEVLHTYECNILFKSNELKTYSFFFPFKSGFHSAVLESSRMTPKSYHPISISVDIQGKCREKTAGHMQRIIHISNIPSDVQKTPSRDEDIERVEPFVADLSNVSEIPSSGFRSIQHSKNSSLSQWHYRAQSSNALSSEMRHSRFNFSWIDKPFGLD